MRILILDEHVFYTNVVRKMLEHLKIGDQIVEANNITDAEILLAYNGFNTILVNISFLPLELKHDAKIIAVSSWDRPQEAFEKGANAFLKKPFSLKDLQCLLNH